jgi:hypothetical protein
MNRNKKIIWMVVIVLSGIVFLGFSGIAFAQEDAEGCKDHPMFTRMNNFYIARCRKVKFDQVSFRDEEGERTNVEGEINTIDYAIREGFTPPSELQVVRNYENAIKKIGGRTVYQDGNNEIWLKLDREGKIFWVYVNSWHGGGKGETYGLKIVEEASMQQEVVAGANLISDIRATGHASKELQNKKHNRIETDMPVGQKRPSEIEAQRITTIRNQTRQIRTCLERIKEFNQQNRNHLRQMAQIHNQHQRQMTEAKARDQSPDDLSIKIGPLVSNAEKTNQSFRREIQTLVNRTQEYAMSVEQLEPVVTGASFKEIEELRVEAENLLDISGGIQNELLEEDSAMPNEYNGPCLSQAHYGACISCCIDNYLYLIQAARKCYQACRYKFPPLGGSGTSAEDAAEQAAEHAEETEEALENARDLLKTALDAMREYNEQSGRNVTTITD